MTDGLRPAVKFRRGAVGMDSQYLGLAEDLALGVQGLVDLIARAGHGLAVRVIVEMCEGWEFGAPERVVF